MAVAKNWREVRAQAVENGLDETRVAAHHEHLEGAVRAYRLAEVRRAQHVTQTDIARSLGISQPRVSRIERGELDRTELVTLRGYVEALGGQLRVVADFGDEHLTVG